MSAAVDAVRSRLTRNVQRTPSADLRPADRALLFDVARKLDGVPAPRVAVVTGSGPSQLDVAIRDLRRDAQIHTLSAGTGRCPHVALAARGPFDVIIDESVDPVSRARVFVQQFLHLRPGGTFVIRRFRAGTREGSPVELPVGRLVRKLMNGRSVRAVGDGVRLAPGESAALSAALGDVQFGQQHLFVTNEMHALPKLREEQVDDLLRERQGAGGAVLSRIPATHFSGRCVLQHNLADDSTFPEAYDTPELALRAYEDVFCTPYQGVFQGDVILPDTYRHNQRARLTNPGATHDVTSLFAAPTTDLSCTTELAGTYFHFDNQHRGHFGHVLTEQLSRLWAFQRAREEHPDLCVLIGHNHGRDLMGYERSLLRAIGAEVPVTVITGPVRVERLLSATPMMSHPEYIHPAIAELWSQVGRAVEAESTLKDLPSRVFCSRRQKTRTCLNAGEVEDLFRGHGFTVVYPEDLPFSDQVAMFRRADAVAGYAGSALFTSCFSERPIPIICVTSEGYTARNEYMVSSVLGHHLTMVFSKPTIPASAGWRVGGFSSPYRVDFSAEGKLLVETLGALG